MSKKFLVKFYDKTDTLIGIVNPSLIMSDIAFTAKINGGQSDMRLKLKSRFDQFKDDFSFVEFMNHARVYMIDKNHKKGRIVYTGYIESLKSSLDREGETLTISLLGLASKLSEGFYGTAPTYDITENDDPANIAKKVIDSLKAEFPNFIQYSGSTVQLVGSNVNYDFKKLLWSKCLKKCVELAGGGYYWVIDSLGDFYFKEVSSTADYIFQIGRDVEQLSVDENILSMKNYIIINYDGGSTTVQD